ncbi:hypothetical protein JRQ81_009272, partial [Phrynocephalus forsythii]
LDSPFFTTASLWSRLTSLAQPCLVIVDQATPSPPALPAPSLDLDPTSSGEDLGLAPLAQEAPPPAASLGVLQGIHPKCINQVPPQEASILPPPIVITLPGAILSATPIPLQIGGNAPCAVSGSGSTLGFSGIGSGNLGLGISGFGSSGLLGSSSFGMNNQGFLGRRGSVCLNPLNVCH